MKKLFIILALLSAGVLTAVCQPGPGGRPFEIDESFKPTLTYLQKVWKGQYDGMEPNSRIILTVSRTLTLRPDMTYTNLVTCHINQDLTEITMKLEEGQYSYTEATGALTYTLAMDSVLDINVYLKDKAKNYTVTTYSEESPGQPYSEQAQFTAGATDDARKWVMFDKQLKSAVDPSRDAVYVMTGSPIDDTEGIDPLDHYLSPLVGADASQSRRSWSGSYDLRGMQQSKTNGKTSRLIIVDGRKVID